MTKKNSGIYEIRIKDKIYIGSSVNVISRKAQHKFRLKNETHDNFNLQAYYNKYGINEFVFRTLELCPKEDLLKKEQEYIDSHNKKSLLNIFINVKGIGRKTSNEAKEKQSLAAKKRPPNRLGAKASKESKVKMSDSNPHKGKTMTWSPESTAKRWETRRIDKLVKQELACKYPQ